MNHTKLRLFLCLLSLAIGSAAMAEPPEGIEVNIPAQSVGDALNQFAEQSGLQVVLYADDADGVETKALVGHFGDPALALAALLATTGLEHEFLNANTVTVKAVAEEEVASDLGNSRTRPVLMAQNQTPVEENQTGSEKSEDDEEDRLELEKIIVTGTNIRGIAPDSSPVRIYTSEDIQISGAATAQDFIQTLTANFGGGSNEDLPAGPPNDNNAIFNSAIGGSFGSSVNLRGLGSGSTLVLLNGHRLAPSSGIGDFVDISMIPASAIERVEVLTDGASSIYGSDAVAGVTNFILRDDFEGLETSFRYGIGTQNSSPEEFRAGVTGGFNWDSGHALLSYEYFNQDEIGAQDRSFSEGAPLPNYLKPSQERHSVLGSLSQDLTSNLEAFADLTFSERKAVQKFRISNTFIATTSSDNFNISAGGTWKAADTWFVDFSGTYSKVDTDSVQLELPDFPREAAVDSKVWIADVKTSGTVLRLPGGDLKLALGGHFRTEDFTNIALVGGGGDKKANRDVYAVFGEAFLPIVGPGNALPGIERLEVNVSGRYDDFSDFGSTANPKVGVLWAPIEALKFRGSYSTSFNPPPLGRVGAADFGVGAVNNSFFGIAPADPEFSDAVTLTVFGTDKSLDAENSRAFTAGLDFDHKWHRNSVSISSTWFDIKFENRLGQTPVPGNFGIFNAPNAAIDDPGAFPEGTIIFLPSIDQINDLLNSADFLVANLPPAFGDPLDAKIINFVGVVRNLALTQVSGFDFDMMYTYESEIGDLIFGIDGSYLNEFKQQAAVTVPAVESVSTLYNPVDLKLRGRAGYSHNGLTANVFVNYVNDYRVANTADAPLIDSWTTVDLSLSFDTQNKMQNSILNDTLLRLSVINLFDRDPPSAPSNASFLIRGYDPTNASPLGRFISLEVTKRF